MSELKLPLGIESFKEMRGQGFYYIDKTLWIRDLLGNRGKVNLFTRPRRFGKTLNMSMLKAFFETGGDAALFDGLAITGYKRLCDEYMGKYPVIFVTLKNVDGLTFNEARARLSGIIRDEAKRLRFLKDSPKLDEIDKSALDALIFNAGDDIALQDSLKLLTDLLYRHYGERAIVLIDEYDVPLDKAYQGGYYAEMINLIRALFGQALKTNDSLYFAVLTGCLRVSKESIFTGLNNLNVHTIADKRFDEYFGFTDCEVKRLLNYYDLTAYYNDIKDWYDGYLFGEQPVYCPWDVINYCYDLITSNDKKPKAYWIGSSGNDIVRRLIDKTSTGTSKMEIERLIDFKPIRKQLNERLTHNEIDGDINNLWSLLFMTGYLTMTGEPDDDVYELIIPNKEVRMVFVKQIRHWFDDKAKAQADVLSELFAAFESGDANGIQNMLNRQLLSAISYFDARESFYHGFLLALLTTCADWQVYSNAEAGKGRSDISVERVDGKRGFVVELKEVKRADKLETACAAALAQIDARDYTAALKRYRAQEIWKYGVAFCDKECKVLAERA